MKIRISAMVLAVLIIASSFITVFAAASNTDTSTETETTQISTEVVPTEELAKLSDSSFVEAEVRLNKKNITIKEGDTFKLKATTNVEESEVTFTSENKKVATVSKKGVITAKKKGNVIITATYNGVSASCKVKITEAGNNIADSTMQNIANAIGWQRQGRYYSSSIMCSAYSFAYAYKQVTGNTITPGSVWYGGGCTWAGGTQRYFSSASAMLQTIKSEIDQNKACVGLLSARGSTHYVTFYSYTGDGTSLSDFTVLDPWDGRIKNASEFGYWSYQVVTING